MSVTLISWLMAIQGKPHLWIFFHIALARFFFFNSCCASLILTHDSECDRINWDLTPPCKITLTTNEALFYIKPENWVSHFMSVMFATMWSSKMKIAAQPKCRSEKIFGPALILFISAIVFVTWIKWQIWNISQVYVQLLVRLNLRYGSGTQPARASQTFGCFHVWFLLWIMWFTCLFGIICRVTFLRQCVQFGVKDLVRDPQWWQHWNPNQQASGHELGSL